jgi:hypothetical protein
MTIIPYLFMISEIQINQGYNMAECFNSNFSKVTSEDILNFEIKYDVKFSDYLIDYFINYNGMTKECIYEKQKTIDGMHALYSLEDCEQSLKDKFFAEIQSYHDSDPGYTAKHIPIMGEDANLYWVNIDPKDPYYDQVFFASNYGTYEYLYDSTEKFFETLYVSYSKGAIFINDDFLPETNYKDYSKIARELNPKSKRWD